MLPHVNHGVGSEAISVPGFREPAVHRMVRVGWGEIGLVHAGGLVHAVATRRLDRHEHIAELEAGRRWARSACPVHRPARSRSATRRTMGVPAPSTPACPSLKESGTLIIRPSSSGIATFIATSSGVRPASDASHSALETEALTTCN